MFESPVSTKIIHKCSFGSVQTFGLFFCDFLTRRRNKIDARSIKHDDDDRSFGAELKFSHYVLEFLHLPILCTHIYMSEQQNQTTGGGVRGTGEMASVIFLSLSLSAINNFLL